MLFIIGNGFDIAMGLKTSFRDFVNWYLSQKDETEDERVQKFKNKIQSDIETDVHSWADLEIKLGEYTAEYKADEADDFLHVYWNLKEKLNEYIKYEENRQELLDLLALFPEVPQREMSKFLLGFYKEFPLLIKHDLDAVMGRHFGQLTYNFINFNFTSTLSKYLSCLPDPVLTCKIGHSPVECVCTLGDILHIHGKVDDKLLTGVDSKEQICNEAFRQDMRILRALVKPLMNEQLQEHAEFRAHELINRSSVICVFGMSLGDSDISWWGKLGEWLMQSNTKRLIIFWYSDKPISPLFPDIRLTREDSVRKSFAKKAGFTDSDLSSVGGRIIVHIHHKIFDME
ncbi:MAG: bacteriophage abortive infection AbiH family protein [Defluviitaleaceae bacterium]|nr:bacteriophage abortive infection AbiH family protein [Defluviitaleaceae bacterium]